MTLGHPGVPKDAGAPGGGGGEAHLGVSKAPAVSVTSGAQLTAGP